MNRSLTILLCCIWLILLLLAPYLANKDPRSTNPSNILAPPSSEYIFGTDNLGRDVFSRTAHGGYQTLSTTGLALLIATVPATLLAMIMLLSPSVIQKITDIVIDAWLAFPSLIVALVVLSLLGRGNSSIAFATGIAQLPYYFRVVLSLYSQEQKKPYILAAKSLGASEWHLMYYHILPNTMPSQAAYTSVTFAYCLINSAALSLLGLGADPSIPEWGVMLATGRTAFQHAPWAALAPAVAISVTVICANRLADLLR